jgi:hypothetical protein
MIIWCFLVALSANFFAALIFRQPVVRRNLPREK